MNGAGWGGGGRTPEAAARGDASPACRENLPPVAAARSRLKISALNRDGCDELVTAIYQYLEAKRNTEHRAEETQMTEEARGIASIDPEDPRFKVIN